MAYGTSQREPRAKSKGKEVEPRFPTVFLIKEGGFLFYRLKIKTLKTVLLPILEPIQYPILTRLQHREGIRVQVELRSINM